MSRPEGAADDWLRHDLEALELRAISTHVDAPVGALTALLGPLLPLDRARSRIQPMLEQAWERLVALRELTAELQGRFPDDALAPQIQAARDALGRSPAPSLDRAADSLEYGFELCQESAAPAEAAAGLRAAQALALAVGYDFELAAALSGEAATLAAADPAESWRYRVQQAECLLDQGREFNDVGSLEALERLCEATLLPMVPAGERDADRAWVYRCLGQARGILGRQQSAIRSLERAAEAFECALALSSREDGPFEWAAAHNDLGNALGALGMRQLDRALLDRSVAAFDAALEVPSSNAAPEARASAHSNLAAVLQTLGQQRKDAALLERAIGSYKAALATWTPERRPLVWATTIGNVGAALRLLGGMRKDPELLEQSVAAYRGALSVRTRERMPREWAISQNDLGAAQQALGEETDDRLAFGRAVAAYREAMKELDRAREPMIWAMTIANLGVARRKLAERTGDLAVARRAAEDIKLAVDVFRDASHPEYSQLGLEQLAMARDLVAALETPASS